MSYTGLEFELYEGYDPSIQYCIPIKVVGHTNFNVLAVWTMKHKNTERSYIGQVYQALNLYEDFVRNRDTIIIGDFNSNKQWDNNPPRIGNHSAVVKMLKDMNLVSIYHEMCDEDHGSETQHTYFMSKKMERPYHIDYCFVPESWVARVKDFKISDFEEYKSLSDHVPIYVEFDL